MGMASMMRKMGGMKKLTQKTDPSIVGTAVPVAKATVMPMQKATPVLKNKLMRSFGRRKY